VRSSCLKAIVAGLLAAAVGTAAARSDSRPTTLVDPPWDHCYGLHRVSQMHLDLYSGYRKKFKSPQGIAAVKLTEKDEPGPRDDDELTVYGVNSLAGEIIYNTSLLSVAFYGSVGSGEGEFNAPTGIAADAAGDVVVADTGNDRIVFLRNENGLMKFVLGTNLADSGEPLSRPTDVAIEKDTVYVVDSGNDRIVLTDLRGRFLRVLETSFELKDPFGIAVIADWNWNHYNSRFVVVTDSSNARLVALSLSGRLRRVVAFDAISDREGGFYYPAIDYYSNVYVTDTKGGRIYKFDRALGFLTALGGDMTDYPDLDEPRGITIHRRFGQIFVAERKGASYFWVGTDVLGLVCKARLEGDTVIIQTRFLLTEQSKVSVELEDEKGTTLSVLAADSFMEPGRVVRTYHVKKNLLPCPLAKCKCMLVVKARATYSSRKYLEVVKKAILHAYKP